MAEKKKKKAKAPRLAIVASSFNKDVTAGLLKGALDALKENGVDDERIEVLLCPGAFEIPLIAKKLCIKRKYDAIICLGAVIKGETAHFEYISFAVSKGIMDLNIKYDTPVLFGVLTCYTDEQAVKRSSNDELNKGRETAVAALEMIELMKKL